MVHMSIIPITEGQKLKLIELTQLATNPIIRRARLILAYAEGKPTMQAAIEAGISRGRARFWKRQFLAKGMEIFNSDSGNEPSGIEPVRRLYAADDDWLTEPPSAPKVDEIISPQEKIPFPKPQKSIDIQPDDNRAEAGRKVWLY